MDQVQVSFLASFPRLGKPVRQRLMGELRLRLALCRAVKDRSRHADRRDRNLPQERQQLVCCFRNDAPKQHVQLIEVEAWSQIERPAGFASDQVVTGVLGPVTKVTEPLKPGHEVSR